jgi:hypothetical protein
MSTLHMSCVSRKDSPGRRELVMLAPRGGRIPGPFRTIEEDSAKHQILLDQVQELRGRIMVEEGALPKTGLDSLGRHRSDLDEKAWHLVVVSGGNRVTGCVRYHVHPSNVSFQRLSVRRAAAASGCKKWAHRVKTAVEGELASARHHSFSLVEIGGWVLEPELRGSAEGIRMALGTFAWGQIAGGCLGITTATVKHGSSSMLRRIGGSPLRAFGEPLPRYYDPDYNCEIDMLRFDSRSPNPAYAKLVDDVRHSLLSTPVICPREKQLLRSAS